MTLEELFNVWIEKQAQKVLCSVDYLRLNMIRRSIEAKYHIEGQSKGKAEALYIINHEPHRVKYNITKENAIIADAEEEKASRAYYLCKS